MNEPARTGPAAPQGAGAAGIPPPPFIRPPVAGQPTAFVPLSPRVVVLIVAAVVLGLLLWMARDAVRPFVVGLLMVYLLDPPVRWLSRHGLPRPVAILLVYVVAMILGIPRLGFWPAMVGSLVLYMGCVGLVKLVLR